MNWLVELQATHPVPHAVLVLSLVTVAGMGLGSLRVRGIGLGISGVLLAGIVAGHFGIGIAPETLAFVREFGLVLFVFTIGMQVGPGFFSSMRATGLRLNLLAGAIVLLGAGLTLAISRWGGIDMAAAVGLFAGATTNTPALGAAQQALRTVADAGSSRLDLPALGYAATYPFGILGIILAMVILRGWLKIDAVGEAAQFQAAEKAGREALTSLSLLVTNPNLNGMAIRDLPGRSELGVVVSRVRLAGEAAVSAARAEQTVRVGDQLQVVGTRTKLDKFRQIVGQESGMDLKQTPGPVVWRRMLVTRREVLGKRLSELGLEEVHGVTVTRLVRGEIELTATPELGLKFGDVLQVVGEEEALRQVEERVGNSTRELNHTDVLPLFLGIGLGVLLGLYPFKLASMPVPLRLGLAGGPLLVAILLSRIGKIGPVVWHLPLNANHALRQVGIVLFLSCVGLKAGEHFFATAWSRQGLAWMGAGVVITLVPLMLVGWFARCRLKMNFMNVCGLLSGSMTDPPALAFANTISGSEAPSVAYATVYPLTMLLRIVVAQVLVMWCCR